MTTSSHNTSTADDTPNSDSLCDESIETAAACGRKRCRFAAQDYPDWSDSYANGLQWRVLGFRLALTLALAIFRMLSSEEPEGRLVAIVFILEVQDGLALFGPETMRRDGVPRPRNTTVSACRARGASFYASYAYGSRRLHILPRQPPVLPKEKCNCQSSQAC